MKVSQCGWCSVPPLWASEHVSVVVEYIYQRNAQHHLCPLVRAQGCRPDIQGRHVSTIRLAKTYGFFTFHPSFAATKEDGLTRPMHVQRGLSYCCCCCGTSHRSRLLSLVLLSRATIPEQESSPRHFFTHLLLHLLRTHGSSEIREATHC